VGSFHDSLKKVEQVPPVGKDSVLRSFLDGGGVIQYR
jgi:hypothetical protein